MFELSVFQRALLNSTHINMLSLLSDCCCRWLGCKWTMAASLICYMPYILAQVYSRFYTLIPAGFLDGLGAGPLWCAKCIYLNVVAEIYSKITGVSVETVLARFFGIFFMIYELSEVWGNLISSTGTKISPRVTKLNCTLVAQLIN